MTCHFRFSPSSPLFPLSDFLKKVPPPFRPTFLNLSFSFSHFILEVFFPFVELIITYNQQVTIPIGSSVNCRTHSEKEPNGALSKFLYVLKLCALSIFLCTEAVCTQRISEASTYQISFHALFEMSIEMGQTVQKYENSNPPNFDYAPPNLHHQHHLLFQIFFSEQKSVFKTKYVVKQVFGTIDQFPLTFQSNGDLFGMMF